MKATPLTVTLDRARRVLWSNSAIYRMSCIKLHPEGGYGTLVAMIWACLHPDDAGAFPSPEHVALHLPADNEERITEAGEVVRKLMESRAPKNADGSTPQPSPASSLD